MKNKYIAVIGGASWSRGPELPCATITEARKLAESYGNMADYCRIERATDRKTVAFHRRDTNGNGMRWYKASF
jgi:hypothetical protein